MYKGEKYIYLLMGYKLAKQNNGQISIGEDGGMVGQQQCERTFVVQQVRNDVETLTETKSSKHGADFSRTFEVYHGNDKKPMITDYVVGGDNYGKNWKH